MVPADHRHRAADVRLAVGRHRRARRRRAPVLLRRHQPDRPGRDDRHRTKVFRASRWDRSLRGRRSDAAPPAPEAGQPPAVACGVDDGEGDYLNCPLTRDEYERFYDALMSRRVGDGARLRQGEVLRGLPADRGHGASRPRHAALRTDEAGRARRSAHRPRAVRRRAAAAGQPRRRSLQPGRLPDAVEMGRAGARAAADSRASSRPSSSASAWCTATPTSTARRCCARRGRREASRRSVFRRTDLRRRGLRRVGGVRPASPAAMPRRLARRDAASAPPRTTAIGALAYYVSHADPGALPADQHHVRHHARRPSTAAVQTAKQRARDGRLSRSSGACRHSDGAGSRSMTDHSLRRSSSICA